MNKKIKRQNTEQSIHSSQEQHSILKYRSINHDCFAQLVDSFNEVYKYKKWMVPIGDANSKIDGKVIGQTYIINGPAQSGKTSLVYWALRNDNDKTAIITVDCSLYRTQMQFIQKLTRQIGQKIGVFGMDKRTIASQNIKFSDLNAPIKQKGIPVVIIIRNAQRLVQYRKQILLYNLLQWILSDIKKMVGLVFITRLIYFVDRFQKRVRSRLSATNLVVHRPNPENIILLLSRRIQCLIENERKYKNHFNFIKLYQKIFRCMLDNRDLIEIIKTNQQFAQKDIVFYLNAMKIVLSSYQNSQEIQNMSDKQLKIDLSNKFKDSFQYIFPFIPKNLLKTCSYPQLLIISIICYMGKNQQGPFCFKTIYQTYLNFMQTFVTSQGSGSSLTYPKNVLERGVLKLEQLNLIQLESKQQSLWNCDIRCSVYHHQLMQILEQINQSEKLPAIILKIIYS